MNVIRPIEQRDLPSLQHFAKTSGPGFTSLPDNQTLLEEKIVHSQQALSRQQPPFDDAQYLFVLEDSTTGNVLGTTGIIAAVGMDSPWYHYRIGKVVHASRELEIHNQFNTLYLCNDYTGCTEICTLYLDEQHRHENNGPLLSKSRFLFIAAQPECFAEKVIAEMRGFSDDDGRSPFWEGLGRRFFTIDFSTADYLTGSGNKSFIAELMPKYSMYIHLLPEEAQAVIGRVHKNTEPARRMLESEGFRFEDYVDIFDAGPTLCAPTQSIRAVSKSRTYPIEIKEKYSEGNTLYLVSNDKRQQFRCALINLPKYADRVVLSQQQANALLLSPNEQARAVPLKDPTLC